MLGKTSLQFKVKACSNVYLALSELKGHTQTLTYEIAIGLDNNSQSQIRESVNGNVKARVVKPCLDCFEMRPFWVTWQRGDILIGHGDTIGENKFLIWHPVRPHSINAVSMAFDGTGLAAWEFYTPVGKFNG